MPDPTGPAPIRRSRRTRKIVSRAADYVLHGWPVAALAVPRSGACPCGHGCVDPHLVSGTLTNPEEVEAAWPSGAAWELALTTEGFDVLDLPARRGASLAAKLSTRCAIATAPRGRRWFFVVEPNPALADLVMAGGGRVHSGANGWVACSPTWTEATGRIGWTVTPAHAHWKPYIARNPIEDVFSDVDPAAPRRTDGTQMPILEMTSAQKADEAVRDPDGYHRRVQAESHVAVTAALRDRDRQRGREQRSKFSYGIGLERIAARFGLPEPFRPLYRPPSRIDRWLCRGR
jgi:hypothetical protein